MICSTVLGRQNARPARDLHLVERKQHGTNPGITVRDPQGREWHVKQPPHTDQGDEGPIEVTLSRVLSAVGYHQPPVYFVPSLTVLDRDGTHVEPGGRFRLSDKSIHVVDEWSWQQNPFVGMRPYQGLLVILAMFNSSDIKNENNTLYEVREPGNGPKHWYVVRDLGTALGETGRLAPLRGNPDIFERQAFILDVKDGFVRFNYRGWHQELFRRSRRWISRCSRPVGAVDGPSMDGCIQAGSFTLSERFIAVLRSGSPRARASVRHRRSSRRRADERRPLGRLLVVAGIALARCLHSAGQLKSVSPIADLARRIVLTVISRDDRRDAGQLAGPWPLKVVIDNIASSDRRSTGHDRPVSGRRGRLIACSRAGLVVDLLPEA